MEKQKKIKDICWRQGVNLFINISTSIAVPIIFATIAGIYLDKYFESKPYLLLGLLVLGILVSCFGIYKIFNSYMKNIATDNIPQKIKGKF